MMIKTVWAQSTDDFDRMVNEALQEGFILRMRGFRELVSGLTGFYAELDKTETETADEGLVALKTVQGICAAQDSCKDCPLAQYIGDCVCDAREPENWDLPE